MVSSWQIRGVLSHLAVCVTATPHYTSSDWQSAGLYGVLKNTVTVGHFAMSCSKENTYRKPKRFYFRELTISSGLALWGKGKIMCARVHTPNCPCTSIFMPVESRGQPQVTFLRYHAPILVLETDLNSPSKLGCLARNWKGSTCLHHLELGL